MCFQTTGVGAISRGFGQGRAHGFTYILEAEELVAAVVAYGAGVCQQLLEGRQLWGIWVLLRRGSARSWTCGSLQRASISNCVTMQAQLGWSASLTVPDFRRPKNEVMAGCGPEGGRRVESGDMRWSQSCLRVDPRVVVGLVQRWGETQRRQAVGDHGELEELWDGDGYGDGVRQSEHRKAGAGQWWCWCLVRGLVKAQGQSWLRVAPAHIPSDRVG